MKKINGLHVMSYFVLLIMFMGVSTIAIIKNETKYITAAFVFFLSIAIFLHYYAKNKDVFNPDGVFSFIWLFSVSLSQFRLSIMQFEWSLLVWFVVISSWVSYLLGSQIVDLTIKNTNSNITNLNQNRLNKKKLKQGITLLFFISIASFILEVVVAGYVPILSSNMGAYRSFGISFVHYNTVSMAVVVLLSFYYLVNYKKDKRIAMILLIGLVQIISIVSRQLLIFVFFGGVLIYHYKKRALTLKSLSISVLVSFSIFGAMGLLRNQSLDYLYYVAQIKPGVEKNFLMWPYLYLSMGFENLRNLIMSDVDFTFGRLILEPLWALTRIKTMFLNINLGQYNTIPEFNVSTFLRDFYLDFGLIGTLFFPFIIGIVSKFVYRKIPKSDIYLFVFIFVLHNLTFSFFVNFYSNTSIMINLLYFSTIYYYSLMRTKKTKSNSELGGELPCNK